MVKADPTLQMNVHQYLVTARRIPTDKKPGSEIISIRVFAPNPVIAKSKFWFQTRRLNKLKKAQGEILSVSEIFEKSRRTIKTYGIVLRYQSRTAVHNMYKEVRDVSLNGAISQLHMEMSGKHRARHDTIQILRTSVITKSDDVKRPTAAVYMWLTSNRILRSNSPLLKLSPDPVKEDSEAISRPRDPLLSESRQSLGSLEKVVHHLPSL